MTPDSGSRPDRQQLELLVPLLGSLARILQRGRTVDDSALETLLMASGLEGQPWAEAELRRWATLLARLRSDPSDLMRDTIAEGLRLRGVPEAVALLTVDTVVSEPGGSDPLAAPLVDLTAAPPAPAPGRLHVEPLVLAFGNVPAGQPSRNLTLRITGGPGRVSFEQGTIEVVPAWFAGPSSELQVRVRMPTPGVLLSRLRVESDAGEAVEVTVTADALPADQAVVPPPAESVAWESPAVPSPERPRPPGSSGERPRSDRTGRRTPASDDVPVRPTAAPGMPRTIPSAGGARPSGAGRGSPRWSPWGLLGLVVLLGVILGVGAFSARGLISGSSETPTPTSAPTPGVFTVGKQEAPAVAPPSPTPTTRATLTPTPAPAQAAAPTLTPTARPSLTPTTIPTATTAPSATPTRPPDPKGTIVLVRLSGNGANDLFRLRLDNRSLERMTGPASAWSYAPVVSPDGQWIAFDSGTPGRADIVVMRPDGRDRRVVAPAGGVGQGSAGWTPDGRIGFHRTVNDTSLIVAVPNGGGAPTPLAGNAGLESQRIPAWPRSGDAFAFAGREGGLWRIFVQTPSQSARAISPPGAEAYAPAWAPDGQRLAFQLQVPGADHGIATAAPDGSSLRTVVPVSGPVWAHGPAWSPDGAWIAYVSNRESSANSNHGDLYIVRAGGGDPIRLTSDGQTYDWRPAWLP